MPDAQSKITLAFLNYNTPDVLIRALESVPAACADIDYHLTVIDNCSTDDSLEKLKNYNSELDVLPLKKNLGFAAGFNKIFNHVNTPFYFLLNSDIILPENSVKNIIEKIEKFKNIGIAGVALIREDGSTQNSFGNFPALLSELTNRSLFQKIYAKRIEKQNAQSTFLVDCIIGAAMIVPRATFDKIGGMDERFFFFLEETDWCKRIKDTGLDVLHFPDIKVIHLQGKSANKVPVKARIEFHRSRLLYFKKHHGKFAAAVLWLGSLIRLIINFSVMLFLTIITLGKKEKFKNKMKLYAGVLAWYLRGCPRNYGLKN